MKLKDHSPFGAPPIAALRAVVAGGGVLASLLHQSFRISKSSLLPFTLPASVLGGSYM